MRIKRNVLYIIVTSVLAVATLIWVVMATTAPTTKEEKQVINYETAGNYSHIAYGQPTKKEREANPKHFIKIVDSIAVTYSYSFFCEEPTSPPKTTVEISAVVSSPGLWTKEYVMVPETKHTGDVTVTFPLDIDEFQQVANSIASEIGIGVSAPQVTLKANVHVEVETKAGLLVDSFVQTCGVKLSATTLEWERPFTLTRKGYWEGMMYEQQGIFGYSIALKSNLLFGAVTVNSSIPPVIPPVELTKAATYNADTTEIIEVTFDYKLNSDEEVTDMTSEVEVNAVLSKPGGVETVFSLIPKTREEENFSIVFPLDVVFFYDIIKAAEGGAEDFASYQLMITANVHTKAQSEYGTIDETLSHTLPITLESKGLTWPEKTESKTPGFITNTVVVPNTGRMASIVGSLGVFGMMVAGLLFAIYRYRQGEEPPEWDEQATRIKKERKDIIVDVDELPPTWTSDSAIYLDSLDELVKIADALLKPVLHKAEPGKHTYYVVDGAIRYIHVLAANGEEQVTDTDIDTEEDN